MFLALVCFFSCGNPPVKKLLEEKREPNTMAVTLNQVSKTKEYSIKEKISKELNEAHSKTDCMIEYLNKIDIQQTEVQKIGISYEEYCQ